MDGQLHASHNPGSLFFTLPTAGSTGWVPILGELPTALGTSSYSGKSAYHGLQATLREQLSHGLTAQLAYTFSKAETNTRVYNDQHTHTFGSDGSDSVEEMATAAQELGYEYVGITDHTPSLKIANGQSIENLRKQIREIDKLNSRLISHWRVWDHPLWHGAGTSSGASAGRRAQLSTA